MPARLFCFVCLILLTGLRPAVAADQGESRLNILFLFADDQRPDTIHAWGNPNIQTPNIDQLVEQGFSFRNNYCFGSDSGAVCIPSRAMVNSGKSYMQIDHQLTGQTTLGQLLRTNGYDTFATGKWHNGKAAILRSFEHGENVFMGGMCDHTKVPLSDIRDGELVSRGVKPNSFSSELFADAAVNYLNGRDGEKPFFAYVAFTAPHDPRNPPEKYREMYYSNPPSLPANFLTQHPFNNGSLVIRDEVLAPWPRPEDMVQRQLCEYYGLISNMDAQIGRILKALEKTPGGENTIIVYAADHGLAMGSHGLLGKQNLYEHSMKCPLIFAGPDIPENKQSEALTYLYDIYPTLCDLVGVQPPEDLDGKDLSTVWKEDGKVRDAIFLSYQNAQRAIRAGDWKLIVYPPFNHQQLFNLANDPHEIMNLADDPQHANKVKRLTNALKKQQQQFGDELPLTVEKPRELAIDLTGHKRKPDSHQPQWIIDDYFDTDAE
ncbi:sulfatase-like hydrolase/transferase [bacterium]|nr:sulfatase-like hydrolase/transferase [bacterium]